MSIDGYYTLNLVCNGYGGLCICMYDEIASTRQEAHRAARAAGWIINFRDDVAWCPIHSGKDKGCHR